MSFEQDLNLETQFWSPPQDLGNLADIVSKIVGIDNVYCVEIQDVNRTILTEKGYTVIGSDFFELVPQPIYSAVVMNPPFSRRQDVRHFLHALKFIRLEGGCIASIMSASVKFRQEILYKEFRDLVETNGGEILDNPEGSFKESGTSVATVTVKLNYKPLKSVSVNTEITSEGGLNHEIITDNPSPHKEELELTLF